MSVLACQVARYFVTATNLRWKTIRTDVIDFIAPFIDGMNGLGESRVARACRVIDATVREATESGGRMPSLRYVFHTKLFWKRLADLDNPNAKPLRRGPSVVNATHDVAKVPPAESPPAVSREAIVSPPVAKRAVRPSTPEKTDAAVVDVPEWLREAIGGSTPPLRAPAPVAFDADELAELRALERAARSRSGLPPPRAA